MDIVKKLNPFKRYQPQQPDRLTPHLEAWEVTVAYELQRHHDLHKKAAAEKELINLNFKIEKLLADIDSSVSADNSFSEDEGCVVCMSAKATMKTFPCGHRVVCRKCFVKTIQSAVAERCFPLKCVVCRTKILKLKQSKKSSRASSSTSVPPRSHLARSLLGCGGTPISNRQRSASPLQANLPRSHHNMNRLMSSQLIYPSPHGRGGGDEGDKRVKGWVASPDCKPNDISSHKVNPTIPGPPSGPHGGPPGPHLDRQGFQRSRLSSRGSRESGDQRGRSRTGRGADQKCIHHSNLRHSELLEGRSPLPSACRT